MRTAGVSIILTTHLMDDVERLADQIHVVKGGSVLKTGTSAELMAQAESSIQFQTEPGLDLVALTESLPMGAKAEVIATGTYRIVGGSTNDVIGSLTAWCSTENVTLESLQTGRRFEDVFIELTADREVSQ